MITYDTIIKEVCQKEINEGCYDVRIDGVEIFHYVKRYLRNKVLSMNGFGEKGDSVFQPKSAMIKSIIVSFFQIKKTLISRKHFINCLYSFRRVDKVDGIYLDKFTDPLIDYSIIGDNYIALEAGREGAHYKPRYHADHVVYADWFNALSFARAKFILPFFKKKYKELFAHFYDVIDKAFPNIEYSHDEIVETVCYGLQKRSVYSRFFKRIQCKRFLAPSRFDFQMIIPAARDNNISVIELQHGITYAETLTYSGFRSHMFVPDVFLAFGEMAPKNVYGIEEGKIYDIGFAFLDYVNDYLKSKNIEEGGVLLISEPEVTSKMISVALKLAKRYPNIVFSFRPHPNEYLSQEQLRTMKTVKNLVVDDNTQNIMVSLTHFKHVIGENSTVLYEALSLGCIVGKLSMEGLAPKYLEERDKQYFYEINNEDDFGVFYYDAKVNENVKHIYSPYNREKFEELIKINSNE